MKKEVAEVQKQKSSMCLSVGNELGFTKIPKTFHPKGCTAADITKHYMDTSFVLRQMLSNWQR